MVTRLQWRRLNWFISADASCQMCRDIGKFTMLMWVVSGRGTQPTRAVVVARSRLWPSKSSVGQHEVLLYSPIALPHTAQTTDATVSVNSETVRQLL